MSDWDYESAPSDVDWEYRCGRPHDTPPKPWRQYEYATCPYCGNRSRWPMHPNKEYECPRCYK